MGREVARGSDEDRRNLGLALPRKTLLHGGLQILDHMEASILAKNCVAQNCNEIGGRPAGPDMGCGEPCGFRYLLLAVAGIQEGAAQLRWRRG